MKLNESDSLLTDVCRRVERRAEAVEELSALELPVVLLDNFEALPESKLSAAIRLSPALYQRKEQRILINRASFFKFQSDVAEAVVAHEIGHAVCQRDSVMKQKPEYRFLSEDILADLLACRWGFLDGLRKERLESYGLQYCELLEQWAKGEPTEVVELRMIYWCQRRLAGLS